MTCIVGLVANEHVYMGADSAAVSDWDVERTVYPKVFRVGEMLMGYTSSFRMGQLLQFELVLPAQEKGQADYAYMVMVLAEKARLLFKDKGFLEVENQQEGGGQFLVGYHGKLYKVNSDFAVLEYQDCFSAVGCGAAYAMGAMYASHDLPPKKRILKALKAAAHFSIGVNGPFHVERV